MVLVESAPVLVHQRIAGPRLGDHQHHRVRERIAAHQQQLERIVERRRIGLTVVDERPDLVEVLAEHRARDRLLPRANPVDVPAQRVDLAVVAHEPERVREVPRRERVRREALVNHRERRHHALVGEIDEILADLVREQHPLVDERSRRHRGNVELLAVAKLERLDRVAGFLADDVELALERVLVHRGSARDEHLADDGLDFLRAQRQSGVVGRHVAPAEQHLALARDRALDLLHARHARGGLLRQEHHADAVLADRRQRQSLRAAHAAQKAVGKLDQNARAVALQRIGAGGATVREVLEDRKRLRDDRVALLALDVGDESQAAGVVLIRRIVNPLPRRRLVTFAGSLVHDDLKGRWEAGSVVQMAASGSRIGFVGRKLYTVAAMLHCGKA